MCRNRGRRDRKSRLRLLVPVTRPHLIRIVACMTNMIRGAILILTTLNCAACLPSFKRIYHDPNLAAAKAIEFSKEAFIDLNQPEAYKYLTQAARQALTLDQFIDGVAKMHPRTFPKVVVATDYQPIPGQEAMIIWLVGENDNENFVYRMEMIGNSSGYQIGFVARVSDREPSTLRKSLTLRRSTEELP